MNKKRVVIIGGGVGGLATAYALRNLMKNLDIVLVSDKDKFTTNFCQKTLCFS